MVVVNRPSSLLQLLFVRLFCNRRKSLRFSEFHTRIVMWEGWQAVAQLVEVLRYKLEGRGFDSQ